MNIKKMVIGDYELERIERDYVSGNSNLEDVASKPKKKSNALRNWVVGGIVGGALAYGGMVVKEKVDNFMPFRNLRVEDGQGNSTFSLDWFSENKR